MKIVQAKQFNPSDTGIVIYMTRKEATLFKGLCRSMNVLGTQTPGTIPATIKDWIQRLGAANVVAGQSYITGVIQPHPAGETRLQEDVESYDN